MSMKRVRKYTKGRDVNLQWMMDSIRLILDMDPLYAPATRLTDEQRFSPERLIPGLSYARATRKTS